jgi:hypothetical protein
MSADTSFAGFTCWDPAHVQDTVFVDAASPSDAVFIATHQPAHIIRRPLDGSEGGERVTEDELLTEFLRPDAKMMLLPILGEPGTGKSHLVRWLWAQIGDGGPSRRVVYVPKYGTSLRKVVELILEKMEGDEAASLRTELREAANTFDERTAPDTLLDALAVRIQHSKDEGGGGPVDQTRAELADQIPAILRDPYFRPYFLSENGVINQFVEKALRGSRPDDRDTPFVFTEDDLPTRVRSNEASRPAREAIRALQWPNKANLAVQMLNQELGPALQRVFGLESGITLKEVMLKTRAMLAQQGAELVLLIEDFTVLQGIQRELLDAIIEPPVRRGHDELCGIRTTLAVTTGYFDTLAGTITTRAKFASHIYDLNVPYRPSGDDHDVDRLTDFVGRYLNATRVGRSELDRLWESASPEARASNSWVPNACKECPYKKVCHESFGSSQGRYGLYPFNSAALKRATSAIMEPAYFDPRAVLGSVVVFTLEQHGPDISRGQFPSTDYGEAFKSKARSQRQLPADVIYAIENYPDPERRAVLLTIWGGCPDHIINLSAGIHQAFRIPMLADLPTERPAKPPGPPPGKFPQPIDDGPLRRRPEQIDSWVAGTAFLSDDLARDIRRMLTLAVKTRIDWDATLIDGDSSVVNEALTQASFDIARAEGGRIAGRNTWQCHIKAEPRSGVMLRGLVQNFRSGHWAFSGGGDAYLIYSQSLDQWAESLLAHCRRLLGIDDPKVLPGIASALELGAAILGIPGADSDDVAAMMAAALTKTTQSMLVQAKQRKGPMGRLADGAISDNRAVLIDLILNCAGARQGGGGVQAIDAAALSPALYRLKSDWSFPEPPSDAPKALIDYLEACQQGITTAVDSELDALSVSYDKVVNLFGDRRDAPEIGDILTTVGNNAAKAKVFNPGHQLTAYLTACQKLREFDLSIIDEVGHLLQEREAMPQRALLVVLARNQRAPLEQLRELIGRIDNWLTDSLNFAKRSADHAGTGHGQTTSIDRAVDAISTLLSELERRP